MAMSRLVPLLEFNRDGDGTGTVVLNVEPLHHDVGAAMFTDIQESEDISLA
jgi:hypothetical protein